MKTFLARSYLRVLPLCLLMMMVVGCDDDDWSSNEIIEIVYVIGDMVLSILYLVL